MIELACSSHKYFSRKEETNAKPVPIDAAVREAGELLQSLVGGPVVVKLDCRAPHAVIMSEPMLIEQILLNLGTNARDAMPKGGFLTISTEEAVLDEEAALTHGLAKGPHAKVIVRDTGSGMSAATKARIFEPFFTTKEVGKGTGLGLATVFAMTRRAGGRIEVDSQIGEGTTFTVSFPSCRLSRRQVDTSSPGLARLQSPPYIPIPSTLSAWRCNVRPKQRCDSQ